MRHPRPSHRSRRHAGQAAAEALVATVVLVAALCLPWVDGESPAALLLGALIGAARAFQHWLFLL